MSSTNPCRVKEESACHILIPCVKSRKLWNLLLALFGLTMGSSKVHQIASLRLEKDKKAEKAKENVKLGLPLLVLMYMEGVQQHNFQGREASKSSVKRRTLENLF